MSSGREGKWQIVSTRNMRLHSKLPHCTRFSRDRERHAVELPCDTRESPRRRHRSGRALRHPRHPCTQGRLPVDRQPGQFSPCRLSRGSLADLTEDHAVSGDPTSWPSLEFSHASPIRGTLSLYLAHRTCSSLDVSARNPVSACSIMQLSRTGVSICQ